MVLMFFMDILRNNNQRTMKINLNQWENEFRLSLVTDMTTWKRMK